jgi:two-component system sensor histidine kinase YesM
LIESAKKGLSNSYMTKIAKSKSYPIRHYVKIMLSIFLIILVLDFIITSSSISIVNQQSKRYLLDTAKLYIDRINHDFSYINRYMGWTLASDENIKKIEMENTTYLELEKTRKELFRRFSELQKNYGQEYNFFLYLKKNNLFSNFAPMNLNYPEYLELKGKILSYIEDENLYEKSYSNWSLILIKDKYFAINIVPYNERYLIALISADDLIRPLQNLNLGEHGFVSLVGEHGESVSSPLSGTGNLLQKDAFLSIPAVSRTNINEQFSKASFSVRMVIEFGAFEKIMIAQFLMILLAVMIASTMCIIMLYMKRRVLNPIQIFSDNLAYISQGSEVIDLKSSKIIELEQANKQFMNLIEQIKKFKIDLYEQELEKQRIQLDFMKLQIKPHFFLNCLTNIYSMAQMQMYKEIEHISISTSKYFRYIFQHGQNFVSLEDEIEHIRIFLDIQKHRYRNALSYHIERQDDTDGVIIPPLVLQTFIENSVKYAVSRTNEIQIVLTVDRQFVFEDNMIVIRISDNGPGFKSHVLEKLTNEQPLDQTDGTHIGIMNTLQRLEILYHKKAKVRFSNMEDGGACVTLYIPSLPPENT